MVDQPAAVPEARLSVLGSPIAHSLSPALHGAAYGALGLDWAYERHEVGEGALASFIDGLGPEWRGLSLTMPLKREALGLATSLDRLATLTHAANTLLIGEEAGRRTLSGFNTDVAGMVRALAESGVTRAAHVSVLGAGATAASALAAAAELGAEDVDILVRTPAKAAHLVEIGRALSLVVRISELGDEAPVADSRELVISTLPGSTVPGDWFSEKARAGSTLFDVAYSPWPSGLARSWQDAGGNAISGLGMLLHQALIQVRIFVNGDPFEVLANEDDVLRAMRSALGPGVAEGLTRPVEG